MSMFGYENELEFIKYYPKTKEELKELVDNLDINLSNIDTSLITDMSELFWRSKRKDFSGIETWNVSNVKYMEAMFLESSFNHPLNDWDISNVKDIRKMFADSNFNQDISKWDVSRVWYIGGMFKNTPLEKQNKLPYWYQQ